MPVVRTRPPVRPTVWLRPVPPLDPPFDDEYSPAAWLPRPAGAGPDAPVPGDAAVAHPARRDPTPAGEQPGAPCSGAPTPQSARRVGPQRSVRPPRAGQAQAAPPGGAPPAPAVAITGASPEARRAARRFFDDCLEVVNGYRPAVHIRSRCAPAVAGGVMKKLIAATARLPVHPSGQQPRMAYLRRLRVCELRPGVVEAAAAIGVAGRTWAMAFRIEHRHGRWVGLSAEIL